MTEEPISAKLRRLRRDAPPAAEDAPSQGHSRVPIKDKLAARERRSQTRRELTAPDPELVTVPTTAGPPADLAIDAGPEGPHAARHLAFAADHQHGDWSLAEVFHADPRTHALLAGDPVLEDVDLSRAVYLDTETTGLSGGAGVYVYMVGLGSFSGARFELWQGFLRDPGDERAVLAEAAKRIRAATAVVSFFGKSFDRHRLEDKMKIAGVEPPFDGLPHLDLYHPFQRLTKGRLPDGRLATMESCLCGLVRADDLPGSQAPAAWFDFLAGRPHRLEGVFRHNRDDILSLVTLAAYLGRVELEARVDGRELVGCAATRARAIARSYLQLGRRPEALPWIKRAIERSEQHGLPVRELRTWCADASKGTGDWRTALECFEALAAGPEDSWTVNALVEVAKIREHRLRDYAGAHASCLRARLTLDRTLTGAAHGRMTRDLERRLTRLAGK